MLVGFLPTAYCPLPTVFLGAVGIIGEVGRGVSSERLKISNKLAQLS
jgi:hypothetical protein